MKKLLLSVLAIAAIGAVSAQKNVIKVKPIRPIGQAVLGMPITLPLAYERVLIPRLTAQVNFDYTLPSTLDVGALDFGDISAPSVKGFGLGGEVRFYPNVTKSTPRGFYLAGFLQYKRSTIESDYSFITPINYSVGTQDLTVDYETNLGLTGTWKALNYGIGIGSQWLIADRVSIDVTWLRVGWGAAEIGGEISGQLVDVNQINTKLQAEAAANGIPASAVPLIPANDPSIPTWNDVGADFEDIEIDVPVISPTIETTTNANGVSTTISLNLPSIQLFGFSIGFAF